MLRDAQDYFRPHDSFTTTVMATCSIIVVVKLNVTCLQFVKSN